MLVQLAKNNYENSAWVLTKFVPRRYVDEFWQRAEPDELPDPSQGHRGRGGSDTGKYASKHHLVFDSVKGRPYPSLTR